MIKLLFYAEIIEMSEKLHRSAAEHISRNYLNQAGDGVRACVFMSHGKTQLDRIKGPTDTTVRSEMKILLWRSVSKNTGQGCN